MEWNINCRLSKKHQFVDTFRNIFPTRELAFTCWNTELNCRSTNYGTRIDYIFIDLKMCQNGILRDCDIRPDVFGSDHCPVVANFDLEIIPSSKCPSYCTKNFPEFAGKQQKLFSFLKTGDGCDSLKDIKKQKLHNDSEVQSKYKAINSSPLSKNVINKASAKTSKPNQKSITNFFDRKDNSTNTHRINPLSKSNENVLPQTHICF